MPDTARISVGWVGAKENYGIEVYAYPERPATGNFRRKGSRDDAVVFTQGGVPDESHTLSPDDARALAALLVAAADRVDPPTAPKPTEHRWSV